MSVYIYFSSSWTAAGILADSDGTVTVPVGAIGFIVNVYLTAVQPNPMVERRLAQAHFSEDSHVFTICFLSFLL
jgi:hypothetical protein